jgi:hypothetical protein
MKKGKKSTKHHNWNLPTSKRQNVSPEMSCLIETYRAQLFQKDCPCPLLSLSSVSTNIGLQCAMILLFLSRKQVHVPLLEVLRTFTRELVALDLGHRPAG